MLVVVILTLMVVEWVFEESRIAARKRRFWKSFMEALEEELTVLGTISFGLFAFTASRSVRDNNEPLIEVIGIVTTARAQHLTLTVGISPHLAHLTDGPSAPHPHHPLRTASFLRRVRAYDTFHHGDRLLPSRGMDWNSHRYGHRHEPVLPRDIHPCPHPHPTLPLVFKTDNSRVGEVWSKRGGWRT